VAALGIALLAGTVAALAQTAAFDFTRPLDGQRHADR